MNSKIVSFVDSRVKLEIDSFFENAVDWLKCLVVIIVIRRPVFIFDYVVAVVLSGTIVRIVLKFTFYATIQKKDTLVMNLGTSRKFSQLERGTFSKPPIWLASVQPNQNSLSLSLKSCSVSSYNSLEIWNQLVKI